MMVSNHQSCLTDVTAGLSLGQTLGYGRLYSGCDPSGEARNTGGGGGGGMIHM